MFKKIFTLAMLFVFAVAGVSFAGVKALPDQTLDDVSAGDWVVLTDADGNQTVEDVYSTNNTLDLLETSQKDIQAVSNANTIDSAVAVQSNVARVSSGNAPTTNTAIYGNNSANLSQYRPAANTTETLTNSLETATESASSLTETSKKSSGFALEKQSNGAASASASSSKSFSLLGTENVNETLAQSVILVGKAIGVSSIAGSLVIDKDLTITGSEGASSSSSSSSSAKELVSGNCSSETSKITAESSKATTISKTESSKTTRDSKGVNNHIALLGQSQQSIKAVSNLNAVASGAAVQANIASNVGVSGTITHYNSATVSSGF